MKCQTCSSQMFVTDETTSEKSHVVFYRCGVCAGEHVSSEPVYSALGDSFDDTASQQVAGLYAQTAGRREAFAV